MKRLIEFVGVVLVICVGSWVHAEPFSDEFNGTSLDTRWTVTSPNPDSSVALDGSGNLLVNASPLNGGSDLYPQTNYDAPRVLQPIDPSLDWTIETRFAFDPANDYQDAGLLLAKSDGLYDPSDEFWRLAKRRFGLGGDEIASAGGPFVPCAGLENYLRVKKEGTTYTGWWSLDGISWTRNGPVTHANSYGYVGLEAIRQPWDNNTAVYSSAAFDYFHIEVVPEPSTFALLGMGAVALLAYLWRKRRRPV